MCVCGGVCVCVCGCMWYVCGMYGVCVCGGGGCVCVCVVTTMWTCLITCSSMTTILMIFCSLDIFQKLFSLLGYQKTVR